MEENKISGPENDCDISEQSVDELIEKALEASKESSDEDDAASEYNDAATQFADLEEELNDAKDSLLRLRAEYDNYIKRTTKEKAEIYPTATAKCIEGLLPVVDSFERALDAECSDENFKKGMDMIFGQMKSFLDKMNVTEVPGVGAQFDPNIHNAIQQQESEDYASGHVCAVYQKGYMIGDKLIRPAMVVVAL
ncbi:MAG: nucleotide exchange factor GrpE [Ruminococcus sp.]|nr:nucleotide exchange factor GrpE [Ruminococcus sp.]